MVAVLFDMNGVIVDDMAYHERAWVEFFAAKGKPLSAEVYHTQLAGRNNTETLRHVLGRELSDTQCAALEAEKEARYRELYAERMTLLPGLERFLAALNRAGIPLAVATSAPPQNVNLVLDGLHIRELFRAVVDAGQVARGKPHPDLFLAAAAALDIAAADCLVFEDSLLGIEAAHRAEMTAIAVTTTHPADAFVTADLVIPDFQEVTIEMLYRLKANERCAGGHS